MPESKTAVVRCSRKASHLAHPYHGAIAGGNDGWCPGVPAVSEEKINEELLVLEGKGLVEIANPIMPCPREDVHGSHRYTWTESKIAGQPIQVGCPGRTVVTPEEFGEFVREPQPGFDSFRNGPLDYPATENPTKKELPGLPTETAYIVTRLLPEIAERMITSSGQYGPRNHRALGPKGQFGDIWRKIAPLKRALWDGIDLPREGAREILADLIGHALLTMEMLDHEVPREGDWDSVVT
jgi:hypothetical protein